VTAEGYDLREADKGERLVMTVPGSRADKPWMAFVARLRDVDERQDYAEEGFPGDDLFSQAHAYARWLSGKLGCTIRVYDNVGSRYIVTCCGGSDYWQETPQGQLHQIGSDGWCWHCFREDRGFVRHPVTPAR
jgi:hypothetical protein